MCFSNLLTIHKVIIKVWHSLSSRIGRAIATFLKKKLVFHTVVQEGVLGAI